MNSVTDGKVKLARCQFQNVLKNLVQENFKHDSESDSDDNELYRYNFGKGHPRQSFGSLSSSWPGSKRLITKAHLKSFEPPKPQPSFVMKLFDRGLDLAQFNDTTPLYPICRAWLDNKPHTFKYTFNQTNAQPATDESIEPSAENFEPEGDVEYREESGDVFRLPKPQPLPIDEFGNEISIRIPTLLPREDEGPFDINYDDELAPSPALLFQNHLERWNIIRQRWREATFENERRYANSITLINSMNDRSDVKMEIQDLRL